MCSVSIVFLPAPPAAFRDVDNYNMKSHEVSRRDSNILRLQDCPIVAKNIDENRSYLFLHLVSSRLTKERFCDGAFDRPKYFLRVLAKGRAAGKTVINIKFIDEETCCGCADFDRRCSIENERCDALCEHDRGTFVWAAGIKGITMSDDRKQNSAQPIFIRCSIHCVFFLTPKA